MSGIVKKDAGQAGMTDFGRILYYAQFYKSSCIKSVLLKITRLCIKVISVYEKGVIISGMINDYKALEELEKEEIKKEKSNYFKSLRIFEAMWNEGISLGVLLLHGKQCQK